MSPLCVSFRFFMGFSDRKLATRRVVRRTYVLLPRGLRGRSEASEARRADPRERTRDTGQLEHDGGRAVDPKARSDDEP